MYQNCSGILFFIMELNILITKNPLFYFQNLNIINILPKSF